MIRTPKRPAICWHIRPKAIFFFALISFLFPLPADFGAILFYTASGQTPILLCVAQDKSRSSEFYGTPQLTEAQLHPLTDHLKQFGAGLALVFLDEASNNQPATRLPISLLPQKPERKSSTSPREGLKLELEYRARRDAWDRERTRIVAENDRKIAAFYNQARADLERPATADESDVAGAMVKCDRILSEPYRELEGREVIRVFVLISDAEHAVRGRSLATNSRIEADIPDTMESNPLIYVVNSARHKGALARKYSVVAVESIESAFQDILTRSNSER